MVVTNKQKEKYLLLPCSNISSKIYLNLTLTIKTCLSLGTTDHFTVVCLIIAWPLIEREAGVDLVLVKTSRLFLYFFAVLMLILLVGKKRQ